MFHTASAVATALIGLAFTLSTADRWLTKRRPQELAWTVAFSLFTVAAAFLAAGAGSGWNTTIFRGFYLFGAIINVPFLGLGTLLLLGSPRTGKIAVITTAAFACFATGVMFATPFVGALPLPRFELAQGSDVLGPLPRLLAALGSAVGAMVVFGGAVFSAWRRRTKRSLAGNGLIAFGTAILGASGMLNSLADAMTAFSVTLALGIAVIFSGFLTLTSNPQSMASAGVK